MERLYPIFLKITDRLCVVVGGGNVAERKVKTLLQDGAKVKVISPELTEGLQALVNDDVVAWEARGYQFGDLQGAYLAFAATNRRDVNEQVYYDGFQAAIPVNTIDNQELCDFIVPSRVERGKLQIAISTSGASPALTKYLRQELENHFGDEYDLFLDWMQKLRIWLLEHEPIEAKRREIFQQVVRSSILDLLKNKRIQEAKEIIYAHTKQEIELSE